MRIGVSGHQERTGIDWVWVRSSVRASLVSLGPVTRGFTSLAIGSDQIFAEEALSLGIPLTAVLPMPDYERCFAGQALVTYRTLLGRCDLEFLPGASDDESSFLAAGQRVVDHAEVMLAIWDGRPAAGRGGTADVVGYARSTGRRVVHIDPIERTVATLA